MSNNDHQGRFFKKFTRVDSESTNHTLFETKLVKIVILFQTEKARETFSFGTNVPIYLTKRELSSEEEKKGVGGVQARDRGAGWDIVTQSGVTCSRTDVLSFWGVTPLHTAVDQNLNVACDTYKNVRAKQKSCKA